MELGGPLKMVALMASLVLLLLLTRPGLGWWLPSLVSLPHLSQGGTCWGEAMGVTLWLLCQG